MCANIFWGYSWSHTKYSSFEDFKIYCCLKESQEKRDWEHCYDSPYDDHEWLEGIISDRRDYYREKDLILRSIHDVNHRIDELNQLRSSMEGEVGDNIPYKCIGVLRSYISCNLDLFIIKSKRSYLHYLDRHDCEKCYHAPEIVYQGIKEWEMYYSNSFRKFQTHEDMVCGVVERNKELFFLVTTSEKFFEITPDKLKYNISTNRIGGMCIYNDLVCMTDEMTQLYHYEGKGIGRFLSKTHQLLLSIPRYIRDGDGWYIQDRVIEDSAVMVLKLLDAGYRLEDDKGNMLTKATVSRAVLIGKTK